MLANRSLMATARLVVTFCLCAWLGYNLYQIVLRIAAYYVPIPFEDYWRVIENLRDYQAGHIGVLWRPHNEHRIIFSEIVFAFDALVAHAQMIVPIACSFLCYALAWGLLSLSVLSDKETALYDRASAVLLAGVCVFWQAAALALARPFLLEWTLVQSAAVVALFSLKRSLDKGKTRHFAMAIAGAAVATYSSSNGLLLWPLLLVIAWTLGMKKSWLAALSLSAAVFVGLYFVGYHVSGQMNFMALLRHPLYFAGFTAMYLSMPFGGSKSPEWGLLIGVANLGLVMLLAWRAWRAKMLQTTPAVVLLSYYAFTLLTIVITAGGRMEPADRNFESARAMRYLTVPFMNWAALILLCLWLSARLDWRVFSARQLTVALSLLLAMGIYKSRNWQEINEESYAIGQVVAMHLDSGLSDDELIARVFPSPEFVDSHLPEMRQDRLTIFKWKHYRWLGQKLAAIGGVTGEKVAGGITHTYPVEGGLEVVGWVSSNDVRDLYPRIYLANEQGQVVGWGRRPAAGIPKDWRFLNTPEREAWIAFVNLAVPSRSITAYAAMRHGLTAIEGSASAPTFEAVGPAETALAADVVWHMDSTWGPKGIPVMPRYGWQTPSAYGSWAGTDRSTGQIVGDFATPQNGCVIVPVLHGPSAGGETAQLLDADTGKVLVDFPFRDHDSLWTLWRVKVMPEVRRLRLMGADNGRDAGEWLAVSAPLACK